MLQDIPTLVPVDPFNPTDDADRLNRAIDGVGTNEDKITEVLCYRTASQRDTITTAYNSVHGVNIIISNQNLVRNKGSFWPFRTWLKISKGNWWEVFKL